MSGRKFHALPSTEPNSNINITPLVDVVLVMLIIFMVATPLLPKDLGVRMPATEEVQDIQDVPPDQLVVKIEASGELFINGSKTPKEEYVERLTGKLKPKKADDKVVFVVADDGANYAAVIGVLDGAKQAGALVLGMATDASSATPAAPPAPPPPPPPP